MNVNKKDDVIIRNMTENDIPYVHAIETASFNDAWDKEAFVYSVNAAHDYGIVAAKNDTVCGFLIMRISFDTADIINVCVAKEFRQEKIGTRLLRAALSYGVQAGVMRCLLEARWSNVPAIRLYENEGFIKEGIRKSYYSNPVEDAIIMIKELQVPPIPTRH